MRFKRFFVPVSVPATNPSSSFFKGITRKLVAAAIAVSAVAFSGQVAKAQTLTVNGVTDLYSDGFSNFAATQVGQSVTQLVPLKVTGGTVTITSFSIPAPANLANGTPSRTQQFKVGALTGCTVGTAAAANAICNISVTFTPAYVGYQTSPLTFVTNRGTFQFGLNGVGVGPQAVLMPGILSTVAGNGTYPTTGLTFSGDGGQATAAQVSSHGFEFDALGNLYEAEFTALAVRKITPAGIISTVAGASGRAACATTTAACGDAGQATAASFRSNLPDVAFDSAGDMYIADLGDNRVRRVDAVSGVITTIAGTGAQSETGDGGAATAATLNTPEAIVVDYQDNIYVLDSNASPPTGTQTPGATVRFINHATGNISTIAGVTATPCASGAGNACGDGGQATAANFGVSAAFYVDPVSGNFWIADRDANRIRFVNRSSGIVSTVAGTGVASYTGDGGRATTATFNGPHGIWVDPAGDLYISDRNNNVVRFVSSASGIISTLAGGGGSCTPAGSGSCGDGTLSNSSTANLTPNDLRLDSFGNLYIADSTNFAIRKVTENPVSLTFPTVAVGTTSGPLTTSLVNIGSSTLTYTTPSTGSNAAVTTTGPSAAASSAFAQTNTTTCGPIYSNTTTGNTLAAGAACNFVISFTPDTTAGNYTGTLIETDNSYNAGATGNTVYPTAATQLVSLAGAATQATATIGVTPTPNPSTYGQTVTIKANLSGSGVAPTGTVSFSYTPTGSATAVVIGTGTVSTTGGVNSATVTTATLPVGTDSIVATYSGDTTYVAGTKSSAVAQVVQVAPGSVDTLTANPANVAVGSPVTLTFTVPTTTGTTAPTGTVTFKFGNTTLGTGTISTTNGVSTATLTTSALPAGTDTVTATYPGDANYGSASPTTIVTVGQTIPTIALTTSPNPSTIGQTVTLTGTVAGGTTPSGNVTFYQVGTAQHVDLQATTASTTKSVTLSLPAGTYSIAVVGANNGGLYEAWAPAVPAATNYTDRYGLELCATCAAMIENLAGNPSFATDTAAFNAFSTAGSLTDGTQASGNPYIFTLTAPQAVSFYVPDGNFVNGAFTDVSSFGDDSGGISLTVTPLTAIGTGTLNGGVATTTTQNLPLGTDPVVAIYNGDASNVYASSPIVNQVVNQIPSTTDAVTAANSTTTVGTADPLTFSIPVVTGAPAPAGTVVFTSGATNLGSATWPATPSTGTCPSGTGTCYLLAASPSPTNIPLTTAPATSTPITATFTATTASGYASGAPTTTVVVNAAGGSGDTLAVSSNPTTFGTSDTLTFSIPVTSGAPAPSGTVVFTAGGVTLGTVTWPASPTPTGGAYTLSLPTTLLPVGAPTTATATFTANAASGYGSAAPQATVTVNKVPLSNDGISATPSATTSGQTVTLTFTVPNVNNTAPANTATVTFTYNGTTLGTANLAGVTAGGVTTYTTTTTTLPVGSDTVTGTFTGDGNYTGGALTTPVAISSNTTTDTVAVTTNPTTVQTADTITFSIPVVNGATAPSGTVAFTSGSTTLGNATWPATPVANGGFYTLTISTTALPLTVAPATSTPVLATYTAATGSGYASATATTTVVVNQIGGSGDAVTAANSVTTVGTADPLTFSIPVVAGAPVPTGTVSFTSGSINLGSATWPATPTTGACPTGGGSCYLLADAPSPTNIPLTVAPATSTPITATYAAGSGSGYASQTATTTVAVNPAANTGDTLAVATNPTTFGASDTLTFSIPVVSGAPAPAGSVAFVAGATSLGSATWPANPTPVNGFYVISVATTAIPVGAPTTVSATFTPVAGSGYGTGTASTTVTVNKVPLSNDGIAANPSATTSGQTVTLTFTVPNVNSTAPANTATVTFTYNGTTLGTANLVGTTTGGVTTYTTTTTALPVGTDTVTGTFTGDGNYTGGALTTPVAISSNTTTDTVTVATKPTTVGSPDVITFSIPVVNGSAAPTGTVSFTSGSTNLGSATWPATPTAANGVYTLSITTSALPLTVSPSTSTPVLATYTSGTGSGYASATATTTVVVNQVSGATDAVTAANSTTTVGTADPLTFSIPVVTGAPVPTGTVSFTSGTTNLGSATWPATPTTGTCPGGTGTCYLLADSPSPTNIPLTVAPATTTPITATYVAGSASGYASATATTAVDVTPVGGTGGTLTVANNPTIYGTPDMLTFSIPVTSGVPAPSGTVVFTAGSGTTTALGAATWPATPTVVNGFYVISITPSNIPVGNPTLLTATFTPSAGSGYGASAPTANVTVNPVPVSSDSITASPNPQTFGSTVTLVFSVPTANNTPPATTTTVTFTNGTTVLGTANVKGVTAGGFTTYTTTTSALPVGSDTVTGTLTGDGNYASGSLSTVEVINAATGNAVLTATPNPTTFGTPVTLTETIVPINGTCPSGPVTFLNNGVSLGTGAVSLQGTSCVATLTTSTLPVGTDNITATVPASNGFAAIASGPVAVTINKAPSSNNTLTTSPNPSNFGQTVTISLAVPTEGGVPATGLVTFTYNGTTLGTANVTNGVATITTATLPVGTDPISASYAGDANYATGTTGPVNQVVNAVTGAATLTATPNPTTFGTSVTLMETIVPINGTCPTGPATFLNNGTSIGTGAISLVSGSCVATLVTSTLPVGTDSITATVPPSGGFSAITSGPVAVVINKAPGTGDTLTTSPNPSTFGQTVTITETLPTVGGVAPTGTVTFTYNGTAIGTATIANGVATITTTTLPVGTDPISANYAGDANYATVSSGPVNQVVNASNGTATLTATPNPTSFGTPVTLTETIAPINGTCPTGPATFLNNGAILGTGAINLVNGSCVATLVTSTLPVGTNNITATVPGSGGFAAIASGPVAVQINKYPGTGDTLTTSPNPSTFGSPVVITETLVTVGGVAPTGSVTFYNNGTSIGTATISGGIATITTSTLPAGTDPITATYTGDANYAVVTSGPVQQVVNTATGTSTLAAGPNPATFGTPVTITETITPINGVCPAGPTTFYNNGTSIGTGVITLSNGSCVATITTSTLPVGTDSITATVPPSNGFTTITSGPIPLVINKANGADTLTSSPNPSVFGSPVVITDTIPTVGGVAPTGTVNFYSFTTLIGTGTITNGVATITTSTLPVGTDSLTGVYLGDSNYAQVTAGPVNQVVTAVSTVATLAAGPNPTNFGTTVTITETIPVTNGTPATGIVTFFSNGTQIGTGTLVNGVATMTTSTLPVGTDAITATYPGDTNYSKVSSGPVNEIVNKANGADTLTVNPDPAVFGSVVTMVDTIPTVGGVVPTGNVSFYNNGVLIGTANVDSTGKATLTSTTLPIGTDPITAVYNGDGNYAPVTTGPVNEVITQGNTIPVLSATPNPSTFGTTVTITESIPGINGVTPTGSVTFTYNGTTLGTATVVNGVAKITTNTLPIGTDPVSATYTGDTTYAPASSGPLNVVVTKAAPTDTLTASPNPSLFGGTVTLTFTVPPVNGVVPTGTVSFYNGTTLLGTGTVNASGVATITTAALPLGTDTVVAQYPGDNNYAPAAPTATVVVNPVTPISIITVPTSPLCGTSVTLTDTFTLVNGVPLGGTVQFFVNGVAFGNPIPVPASGVVTLTTTGLPCTADVITSVYTPPAGSPYLPVTGGPVTINVQNPDFTITATPPNQTVNPGDSTTYTVSLSGANGVAFTSPVTLSATGLPPGATVSFSNGTYTPGLGPTSTTMTIVTSPTQAMLQHGNGGGLNGVYYGLLLLPLLGIGSVRRKIRALPKGITYCLAAMALLGGLGAMTGCGGGYFGPAPKTYTITVTGTSGTLVHSTTVTLTVR